MDLQFPAPLPALIRRKKKPGYRTSSCPLLTRLDYSSAEPSSYPRWTTPRLANLPNRLTECRSVICPILFARQIEKPSPRDPAKVKEATMAFMTLCSLVADAATESSAREAIHMLNNLQPVCVIDYSLPWLTQPRQPFPLRLISFDHSLRFYDHTDDSRWISGCFAGNARRSGASFVSSPCCVSQSPSGIAYYLSV